MKNDTYRERIPSTREEIVRIIIRNFIASNFNTITLALYPHEIIELEEEYKEIIVCKKESYQPGNELSIFTVSKRPQYLNENK